MILTKSLLLIQTITILQVLVQFTNIVYSKFTNVECAPSTYVYNTTCTLKAIDREVSAIYFRTTLKKRVANIFLHFKLHKRSNGYQPYLIDFKEDLCRFLKYRKIRIPYMEGISEYINKYTNINHTCPLEGEIIIDGLRLNTSRFPSYFPNGKYKFESISLTPNNKVMGNIIFYFTVSERSRTLQ